MNKVILRGNVGQEPKITNFDNGGKIAQFSLATKERGYKTKDGKDIPEETTWHNIVVRRTSLAGLCEKYVKKGTPLLVEGKIRNRKYEKDGSERSIMEIIVDEIELLGSGQKEEREYSPIDDLPFD